MLQENKRSLTKKREACYFKIQTYEKRILEYGSKLQRSPIYPFSYPPEQKQTVLRIRNLKDKIRSWQRQIKRIDMVNAKIMALANAVALYTGYNVKDSHNSRLPGLKLAKNLFYKYGLENGLQGKDLREFIGSSWKHQPANCRKEFTNSFKETPENKQQWLNFKEYFENLPVVEEAVKHVIVYNKPH